MTSLSRHYLSLYHINWNFSLSFRRVHVRENDRVHVRVSESALRGRRHRREDRGMQRHR